MYYWYDLKFKETIVMHTVKIYLIDLLFFLIECTAQVVGVNDVAAGYNIGVLRGTPGVQKGKKSGNHVAASRVYWRSPIPGMPKNRQAPSLCCGRWT